MGVYIPNMKMPEHCGECRFAVDGWCYAYGKPNIDALANDGRTNFCPLVPVPPHGRLIDADAEIERVQKLYDKAVEKDPEMGCVNVYEGEIAVLQLAPTIIPASGGKEDE